MKQEVTLRIILEKPPAGVDFGVQKGSGSNFESIQTRRSDGNDMSFEFPVGLKPQTAGADPDFSGPFVQGPRNQRFIYIDIGTIAGQWETPWSRRLKIPLIGITWEMVDQSLASPGAVLEARVPGTGKDGGPTLCHREAFQRMEDKSIHASMMVPPGE